jgi:hypothetical protein
MEGQAPYNCPWCRGNPKDFKEAAGLEMKELPPRTIATKAEDLAAFRLGGAHVNGVLAKALIPIDWGWIITPWLHLILGTGNEVMKKIYVQLQHLDGLTRQGLTILRSSRKS